MREGNASMYLGSPRMAEMVIGEKVSLEEMGSARMHTSRSGCGHALVASDEEGIELAQRYLSFFGSNFEQPPPVALPLEPAVSDPIGELIPADENKPFDMRQLIERLVNAGSLLEIHARWAREVVVAYGWLNGQAVGIVANQPKVKGGVLFVDSSDKCARFIATCNAFNVPLLFLADVPGFMIGTQVEREGIIRHGAKMISAVSEATVPKISVIVRKAYGARPTARGSTRWRGRPSIPTPAWRCPASIAVMGPQAAVNAVYLNQLQAIEDPQERAAATERLRACLRGRHRRPALGLRAGRQCGDRARATAPGADPALRPGSRQGASVAGQAGIRHTGVAAPETVGCPAGAGAAAWLRAAARSARWSSSSSTSSSANCTTRSMLAASTRSGVSASVCESGTRPRRSRAPMASVGIRRSCAGRAGEPPRVRTGAACSRGACAAAPAARRRSWGK